MGFRRFSHAVFRPSSRRCGGRSQGGAGACWAGAGRIVRASRDEIAKLAIERGLLDAYRQVFAILFWFAGAARAHRRGALPCDGVARGGVVGRHRRARTLTPSTAPARRLACRCARLRRAARLDPGPTHRIAFADRRRLRGRDRRLAHAEPRAGRRRGRRAARWESSSRAVPGHWACSPRRTVAGRRPGARLTAGARHGRPRRARSPAIGVGLVWRALVLWLVVILLVTLANLRPTLYAVSAHSAAPESLLE